MTSPTHTVQAVARALRLLEALADAGGDGSPEVGVIELARVTGLSAATAHRLLATLANDGYVTRGAGGVRYRLGARLFVLAASAESPLVSVRERAAPAMERLRDAFGESVNLAVLERRHIVYVHQVESQRSVRAFNRVGNRVLAHACAAGKVLLAGAPAPVLSQMLGGFELEALTPATITDPALLAQQLAQVRRCGFAKDLGEQDAEVICVAAALPVPGLRPEAAISISGPAWRMAARDLDATGRELVRALALSQAD